MQKIKESKPETYRKMIKVAIIALIGVIVAVALFIISMFCNQYQKLINFNLSDGNESIEMTYPRSTAEAEYGDLFERTETLEGSYELQDELFLESTEKFSYAISSH